MRRLVRQRFILHRKTTGHRVLFLETLDGPGKPREARLLRQDWVDMGEPDVLTVTIVPSDLLNS